LSKKFFDKVCIRCTWSTFKRLDVRTVWLFVLHWALSAHLECIFSVATDLHALLSKWMRNWSLNFPGTLFPACPWLHVQHTERKFPQRHTSNVSKYLKRIKHIIE